jgi:hypothetical protein
LLICSIDKAEQIGLNWWRHDPRLSTPEHSTPAIPQASHAAPRPSTQESRHGS